MPSSRLEPWDPPLIAGIIADLLFDAVRCRGRAVLAVPGGRSPLPVIRALAPLLDTVADRLHLTWLDERAVPVDHPDRNDRAILAVWSAAGRLPAGLHPLPAEQSDLEIAASNAADVLWRLCPDGRLDAALVGIGEDGHLASLFPHHPGLDETRPVFPVLDSPKPPPRRLTLSLPVIASARNTLVLAPGQEKAEVAHRAFRGPDRGLPCSLLPTTARWFGA